MPKAVDVDSSKLKAAPADSLNQLSTNWGEIVTAQGDGPAARQAQSAVLRRYGRAVKAYLAKATGDAAGQGGGRRDGQRSGQTDGARGEAGKAEVTVVTASGALETRDVEVGIRNRVSAEIRSGLEEGEKIVVSTGSGSSGNARDGRSLRGMRMPPMF